MCQNKGLFHIFVLWMLDLLEFIMDTTIELRKRVQDYINAADDRLLRLMEALAVSYQENEPGKKLTDAHKKELDRRLQRYNEGKTVFHSWEEVEVKLDRL